VKLTPQQKKLASTFAVGIGVSVVSAVLAEVVRDLPQLVTQLPVWLRVSAVASATGAVSAIAHRVDAWGHTERVEQAVAAATASPAAEPSNR
jgi:pheromone shutdown protein TraB